MPCWHVGPCGVGCDGYTANPLPQPAAPIPVPVVVPGFPLLVPYRTPEEYADLLQSHYSLCCKIAQLEDQLAKKDLQLSEAERKGKDLCQQNGELLMLLHWIKRNHNGYPEGHANCGVCQKIEEATKEKRKCPACTGLGMLYLKDQVGQIACPQCHG